MYRFGPVKGIEGWLARKPSFADSPTRRLAYSLLPLACSNFLWLLLYSLFPAAQRQPDIGGDFADLFGVGTVPFFDKP